MGGKHSKSSKSSHCDYDNYKKKINDLKKKISSMKLKYASIDKEVEKNKKMYELKKAEYDRLKAVCMLNDKDSIKQVGEKIYKMLSDKYKDTINLMNTQQVLIQKQNNVLGEKDILYDKLREKINKMDDNIIKNDRLLELHKEELNYDDKNFFYVKLSSIVLSIIFLMVLVYYYYNRN